MSAISDLVASFETELTALEQSLNAALETAMDRNFSSPELHNRAVARVGRILASISRTRAGTEPVSFRTGSGSLVVDVAVAAQDVTVDDVEDRRNSLLLRNDTVVIEMIKFTFIEG